jgi:hypothetical protein
MTQLARNAYPGFIEGMKWLSSEVLSGLDDFANVWYVDGDNGSDSKSGTTPTDAKKTIQAAVTAAGAGDIIYIKSRKIAALSTDPANYTESIIIPNSKPQLKLIGYNTGLTQGGLPQLKVGATTTDIILTVRAPGCLIANLGFNGAGGTGGGILLDSDGGTTKDAFGTTITGCHFKNCKGTTATDCRTGGAIMWSANGGSWQVRISNNVFYKNVGDIVLKGTGVSVPQDVIIENNRFQGIATAVDCHLFLTGGGSGMLGVTVHGNVFADVLPALSSGSIVRYADMTGCTGIFSNNVFGGSYTTSGFGAAKAAAKIPTTVGIAGNYSDAGLIVREA